MSDHHPTVLHHAASTDHGSREGGEVLADSRWIDEDGARRLGRYGLVVAIAASLATVFYQIWPHLSGAEPCWWYALFWNIAVIVGGLTIWRAAPVCQCNKRLLVYAGLFQIMTAYTTSLPYFPSSGLPAETTVIGVPWSGIVLLLFPMLVPAPPRLHAVIALVGASWIPIIWLTDATMGNPLPPVGTMPNLIFANVLSAGIAIAAAQTVYRMRRRVRRAEKRMLDLGSYSLTRRIGAGGMGEVWQAQHKLLRRPAAIKLISPKGDVLEQRDLFARFEREAQATAQLTSSHTVEVYDFGHTEDGRFFYVMELLDGIDLEQLVDEHGPQPPERVVHILQQMCYSIGEAHSHQFIHRDIKPANIFLCRQGYVLDWVKVLDFGLVFGPQHQTNADGSEQPRLTGMHQITGTPGYIAPELAGGAREITPLVDIYALGCVAFWLLTGKQLFEDPSPMKVIIQQASKPAPEVSDLTKFPISDEFADLIMECLAINPNKRPTSICDFLDRLSQCPLEQTWTRQQQAEWWQRIPPSEERATGTVCHISEDSSAMRLQSNSVPFAEPVENSVLISLKLKFRLIYHWDKFLL